MNRELLSDKYRPQSLSDLSFNQNANKLIIEGPRGCGKKLRVQLYLKEKYGQFTTLSRTLNMELPGKTEIKQVHTLYSAYHHQLNPSIHNIYDRSLIQCFTNEIIHTRLLVNIPYRIIVVEDADMLSTEAQESLRRTLETCIKTCRFIFLVNYEDKMIAPIYSRCITIKMAAPTVTEITTILNDIALKEGTDVDKSLLTDIAHGSNRNLQKAIHMLHKIILTDSSCFKREDHDSVYSYCINIVDHIIRGQTIVTTMNKVRSLLYELVNFCVDCKKLIPILLQIALDKLPASAHKERYDLCKIASERDESIRISSKDIYHVESFCLHMFKTVKDIMITKLRQTTTVVKK
jgi:replication factor C subunit 3/5